MEYVLYTFQSTLDASLAEITIKNHKIKARLVPLLPEIDAGCGLALRFEKTFYRKVENVFFKENLNYDQRYILIYTTNSRKPKVLQYDLL